MLRVVAGLTIGLLLGPVRLVAAERNSGFKPEKLKDIEVAIEQAIKDHECPGAVVWLERDGVIYTRAFGNRAVLPSAEPMTEDTIFDLASLTKAVACAPAVMLLVERGKLSVDDPVANHIPEFSAGREVPTVKQLLLHISGLRPGIPNQGWKDQDGAIATACKESLVSVPGTEFRYSDINYILLGEIVRRRAGMPLEKFVDQEIFKPLKMSDTSFLPDSGNIPRIAPTQVVSNQPLRGVVHDPTARNMQGVAGHAGLFSTAGDLARFARMLLNGGELEGVRILKPETVNLLTTVQTPSTVDARRGLGWDIDSPYSGARGEIFPRGSYGHTGWTGTSMWIDPFSRTFLILLSNRNHPSEKGSVIALRRRIGTLAAEAVTGFDFNAVPGALPPQSERKSKYASLSTGVLNGIDVLVRDGFAPLKNLRIGLITNHTGHDRDRRSTIDLLLKAPGVELKVLFSPEHGIRGFLDERHGDAIDPGTGLPIYSLYGESTKPSADQLAGLDALVYDIQDVGCRFYTYTATMALCMESAAAAGIRFFVLDRVNPIAGDLVEGPVLGEAPTFVGYHAVPLRYGMTIGELAKLFKTERVPHLNLTVISVENWRRHQFLDETGLPWTNPSPNMRNLEAAILYPGVGLLESAVSVGRGTDSPFQLVGAPYINDREFAEVMNGAGLAGVRFVAVQFTPSASIHSGELCRGVRILITDRKACRSVDVGVLLAKALSRLYPQNFEPGKMAHLLLDKPTLQAIRDDRELSEIRKLWDAQLRIFAERRAGSLLYQ